jgi:hypothetical protein
MIVVPEIFAVFINNNTFGDQIVCTAASYETRHPHQSLHCLESLATAVSDRILVIREVQP